MVIQIHQKVSDLGEGSTHTTYDWNEELEEDKEKEKVQAKLQNQNQNQNHKV